MRQYLRIFSVGQSSAATLADEREEAGDAPEAGQEIVWLPIPSASPAKAGVYRSTARACAYWQDM
jgi:hypothetical protein